eukprot:IDg22962t1
MYNRRTAVRNRRKLSSGQIQLTLRATAERHNALMVKVPKIAQQRSGRQPLNTVPLRALFLENRARAYPRAKDNIPRARIGSVR